MCNAAPGHSMSCAPVCTSCAWHPAGRCLTHPALSLAALVASLAQAAAADADGAAAAGTDAAAPYASVVPYVWRLNVTRSDLPYALLRPTVVDEPASLVRRKDRWRSFRNHTCLGLGFRAVVVVVVVVVLPLPW